LRRSKSRADSFLALLRPLQGSLEVYCRRMLRDRSQVEDALQSAVAEAFGSFSRYTEGTNFKAWIFRFVTLEAFTRNRKREPISLDEVPVDLPAEESWELIALGDTFDAMLDDPDVALQHFDDVVVEALARLAPLERAVLLLRAIGAFSYKEIHELLEIPIGSVIGYLSRARQRLRIALADYATQHGLFRGPRPQPNSPKRRERPTEAGGFPP
jgi:RNA polymerase sigma-70 factor (ECF subfamily)